jgi:hypothetical protein
MKILYRIIKIVRNNTFHYFANRNEMIDNAIVLVKIKRCDLKNQAKILINAIVN